MAASEYNFNIEKGASHAFTLIYKDSNGNPIDLTGWCARLTWRANDKTTKSFYAK